MEYELGSFADRLQELFITSTLFPYLSEDYMNKYGWSQSDAKKHKGREPLHLKTAVDTCMKETRIRDEISVSFDIGSERLERTHPYYHILEDAPVIRKKNKGTKKTMGSQASIEDVGKRDYGIVSWNGKTFTKEYTRNVRGSRNRANKVSHWERTNGQDVFVNRESNSYLNTHYHYIENILDSGILNDLAIEYGMKLAKKKIDTGLAEEYFAGLSEAPTNILDILGSFEE